MKNVLLVCLLMLGAMVNAQSINEQAYIEVNGQSERAVTPDEIYLMMNLVADKSSDYSALETQAMKALVKMGIEDKNITLSDAQGNEVSSFFTSKFETERSFLVKVSTAKEVSQVIENLDKIGVRKVTIVKIEYSLEEELMNELRVEAMKDAKMKSELMLSAVDAELGAPLSVRENSWGAHRPMQANMRLMSYESTSKSVAPEISFKKINFTSEVTVRFEILK